jgi:glycopeptide antibiotics resistance protein
MGKGAVRVIRVPKGVTVALLVLVSVAMIAFYFVLAGRTYVRPKGSSEDLVMRVVSDEQSGTLTITTALAILWPVVANVLFFMPWGFLAFIALDMPGRSRLWTYAATLAGGIVFAVAIEIWQTFLPAPITTGSDAVANAAGALAGALAGHLRKQVRIRFEP